MKSPNLAVALTLLLCSAAPSYPGGDGPDPIEKELDRRVPLPPLKKTYFWNDQDWDAWKKKRERVTQEILNEMTMEADATMQSAASE